MTLEHVLATNVFSRTPGGVQREYVPFNEALTAQAFADAINSGRMSVEDAWHHFWTYDEDEKLFGYPGQSLLPAWFGILEGVLHHLDAPAVRTMVDVVLAPYRRTRDTILQRGRFVNVPETNMPFKRPEYNPFFTDARYLTVFGMVHPVVREQMTEDALSMLTKILGKGPATTDMERIHVCLITLMELKYTDKVAETLLCGFPQLLPSFPADVEIGGVLHRRGTPFEVTFRNAISDPISERYYQKQRKHLLLLGQGEGMYYGSYPDGRLVRAPADLLGILEAERLKYGFIPASAGAWFLHGYLKPQGYTPPTKRLVITDDT